MKDIIKNQKTSQPNANGKYPHARRTYRLLGIVHALMFGGVLAGRAIIEGYVLGGILAAVVVGGVTYSVFHWLAEEHYHGTVPGKVSSKED